MSVLQRRSVYGGNYIMVAAIDIGTTYSGYAFCFRDLTEPLEILRDCNTWLRSLPVNKHQMIIGNLWKARTFLSEKTSTCILFDKHKKFHSFGFEAEDNYSHIALDNEHTDYYYFRRFKTMLAHKMAGIRGEHLLIALEPEVASLYCQHLPLDNLTGTVDGWAHTSKYLVLDAGGDTVDITAYEVKENRSLIELYKESCGDKGGTYIDKAFRNLLANIVGNDVMDNFQATNLMDYIDIFREFEEKKRLVKNDMTGKISFRVSIALSEDFEAQKRKTIKDHLKTKLEFKNSVLWVNDKLRIEADVVKGLFKEPCDSVGKHLKSLFNRPELRDVPTILMVGGFCESPMLQDVIKTTMPGKRVIIPDSADLAVLTGAVIFGHAPPTIREYIFSDDGCISERNMHDEVSLEIKQSRDTESVPTQSIQFDISSHTEPSDLTQTKLVEKYSQLYDIAWIKAFEELQESGENEKQCVTILRDILTESYHCCCKMSEDQRTTVATAMTDASFVKSLGKIAASEMPKRKNFDVTQSVAISDLRRETFDVFVASLQLLLKTDPEYKNWFIGKSLGKYSEECIKLCWMMQIHSPPVNIDLEPRNGQEFDTNMLNPYTRSKRKVDFVVWPPLLSENGIVLCKGVAQGL